MPTINESDQMKDIRKMLANFSQARAEAKKLFLFRQMYIYILENQSLDVLVWFSPNMVIKKYYYHYNKYSTLRYILASHHDQLVVYFNKFPQDKGN